MEHQRHTPSSTCLCKLHRVAVCSTVEAMANRLPLGRTQMSGRECQATCLQLESSSDVREVHPVWGSKWKPPVRASRGPSRGKHTPETVVGKKE